MESRIGRSLKGHDYLSMEAGRLVDGARASVWKQQWCDCRWILNCGSARPQARGHGEHRIICDRSIWEFIANLARTSYHASPVHETNDPTRKPRCSPGYVSPNDVESGNILFQRQRHKGKRSALARNVVRLTKKKKNGILRITGFIRKFLKLLLRSLRSPWDFFQNFFNSILRESQNFWQFLVVPNNFSVSWNLENIFISNFTSPLFNSSMNF